MLVKSLNSKEEPQLLQHVQVTTVRHGYLNII